MKPNQSNEDGQNFWVDEYITEVNILDELKKIGEVSQIPRKNIQGDNPSMRYYRIDDKITVGVLAMFSWKYPCGSCHKLRVSPQGNVSVCLNDKEVIKITDTSLEKKKNIINRKYNERMNAKSYEKRTYNLPGYNLFNSNW